MSTDLTQYLETALWSTTIGDTDTALDRHFDPSDVDEESRGRCQRDLDAFYKLAGDLLEDDPNHDNWPHDFWLTRTGHGAGFWDGDYVHGDALTAIAGRFCPVTLCEHDGNLYLCEG